MDSIQQVDDLFPDDIANHIAEYTFYRAQYRYGERDNPDAPTTGLVAQFFHMDTGAVGEHEKIIYDYCLKLKNEK